MSIELREFFIHKLREDTSGASPTFKGTPSVKTDPAAAGPGVVPNPAADGMQVVAHETAEEMTIFRNQVAGIANAFQDLGIDPGGLEQFAATLDGVVYNFYAASPDPFKFKKEWLSMAGDWGSQTAELLKSIGEMRSGR